MIKALFFDMDGTLLNTEKKLMPAVREALHKCRAKGIKTFLATGRSPRLEKMLGWGEAEFALFDGGIFCNGAVTRVGGQTVCKTLSSDTVYYCIKQVARHEGLHLSLYLSDGSHVFNHALPDNVLPFWGLTSADVKPIQRQHCGMAVKILIYYENLADSKTALPGALYQSLQEACGKEASIYLTDQGRTIQIAPQNVSKHTAVQALCSQLGLAKEEIAVFGDDSNDAEMLAGCPNGVAMENGAACAKVAAAYVTHTNDTDGIPYALHNLLGII